jgi:hypothetical protein
MAAMAAATAPGRGLFGWLFMETFLLSSSVGSGGLKGPHAMKRRRNPYSYSGVLFPKGSRGRL